MFTEQEKELLKQQLVSSLKIEREVCRIVEAGVRHRHPDFDEKKIRLEVLRLMIGDKLYRQMLKGTENAIMTAFRFFEEKF